MTLSELDIFIREIDEGNFLVYLPFAKYAKTMTQQQFLQLKEYAEKNIFDDCTDAVIKAYIKQPVRPQKNLFLTGHNVEDISNMMILPNNICNFKCTYCYSAEGRSGKTIDLAILKSAIKYFLDKKRSPNKRLTISVLGGGEPLLSWSLLKDALDYAYLLAEERNQFLPVSIVTNGSIFSSEIADYMKGRNISLSISYDILPEIQNSQRSHYESVTSNINKYSDAGIDVAFNTVITLDNVDRMNDMLDAMKANTPKVKKVSFKSLISNNYFSSSSERMQYYRHFVDNFFEALTKAEEHGIWLTSPYLNNAMCLSDRFCPGKFVVTSDGDISICHCAGSRKDRLYNEFIYGSISDNGQIYINDKKLKTILSHDNKRNQRCKECIAHWHCAGGCYADNSTIGDNEEAQNAYCESMRYFIERFIKKYILK